MLNYQIQTLVTTAALNDIAAITKREIYTFNHTTGLWELGPSCGRAATFLRGSVGPGSTAAEPQAAWENSLALWWDQGQLLRSHRLHGKTA